MTDRSIFTGVSGPSSDAGDPASPIILGHIFQVSSTHWVTAIRFWRGATSINGVQKGRIFAVGSQSIVSGTAVDFPALSGTGWQVATLPTPVQLTANTSYKVCVHFTDNYSATGGYWASGAGVGGRTDGPLTAPDAGGTPLGLGNIKQGSYAVTSNPDTYPDNYFNGGNYWVDLVATDVDPTAGQTIDLGLPVETDSVLALTLAKSVGLGIPATAEAALAQVLGKSVGLALPMEEDAALAASLAKAVAIGLPIETDSALDVALTKSAMLGLPVEENVALPTLLGKTATLSLPAATDIALPGGLAKGTVLGLPTELDSAAGQMLSESVLLGLPVEAAMALALLVNDVWPPSTGAPTSHRWATAGPPTSHRWASTDPPVD